MTPTEAVLARLEGVAVISGGWQAKCPAHEDSRPSLSISTGDDGKVLMKCHAGCSFNDVVKALGLRKSDLFAPKAAKPRRKKVAVYAYRDEKGGLLFECVRFSPKGFSQRRPDGNGGHVWNLKGTRRVVYRLPELLASTDKWTFVVEGEKDCDRLASVGLTATTWPMGAGNWRDEYSAFLAGRNVAIFPDNDSDGSEAAEKVARSLLGKASDVRVVELDGLPEKGDVSDWLDAGGTAEKLLALVEAAPRYTPSATDGTTERPPFTPYILSRCMADIPAEAVTWIWPGKIPAAKLCVFAGPPGVGKSWLTLDICARLSSGTGWPDIRERIEPGACIVISGEDDPADTLRPRLERAGADLTRIHCVSGVQRTLNGDPGYLSLGDDIQALEGLVSKVGAKLLVVDPVACFLGDTNSHRDSDVRAVLGPLSDLANRTRCAVLGVHHLSKGGSGTALHRVMGSLAFIAAARVGWLVAKDPDDDKRRLVLPLKSNIVEDPQGIGFEIQDGVLHWFTDPVTTDADSVLAADAHTGRTERNEAAAWLGEQLAGGPVEVPELKKCAEGECIAWRTVERAKKSLGVVSLRKGYGKGSPWSWQLPTDASHRPPPDKWRPLDNDPENAVFLKDRQTSESGGLCGNGIPDSPPSRLTRSGLTPDRGAIAVLLDRMSRTDDPDQRAALQAEIDGIRAGLAKD